LLRKQPKTLGGYFIAAPCTAPGLTCKETKLFQRVAVTDVEAQKVKGQAGGQNRHTMLALCQ